MLISWNNWENLLKALVRLHFLFMYQLSGKNGRQSKTYATGWTATLCRLHKLISNLIKFSFLLNYYIHFEFIDFFIIFVII